MQTEINYKEYLKSEYWKNIREQVYERDGYKCRICNSSKDICVHHRTYEFVGNEKLEELITLCKNCHYSFHKNNILTYKTDLERRNNLLLDDEYNDFILNNLKYFQDINNTIKENNYILYKDFCTLVKKIIKGTNFDEYRFLKHAMCCCFSMHITDYTKEMVEKYNLPTKKPRGKTKGLIIKRELYDKEVNSFTPLWYTY